MNGYSHRAVREGKNLTFRLLKLSPSEVTNAQALYNLHFPMDCDCCHPGLGAMHPGAALTGLPSSEPFRNSSTDAPLLLASGDS